MVDTTARSPGLRGVPQVYLMPYTENATDPVMSSLPRPSLLQQIMFISCFVLGVLAKSTNKPTPLGFVFLISLGLLLGSLFSILSLGLFEKYFPRFGKILGPTRFFPMTYGLFGLGVGVFLKEMFRVTLLSAITFCLPFLFMATGLALGFVICRKLNLLTK